MRSIVRLVITGDWTVLSKDQLGQVPPYEGALYKACWASP